MLTARQHDTLTFIDGFIREHGWGPTQQEIADAIGVSSKSVAHDLILQLVLRGYLRKAGRLARAIEVIRRPDGKPEPKPVIPWVEGPTTKRIVIETDDGAFFGGFRRGDTVVVAPDGKGATKRLAMFRRY